ncbi:ROK family protein [Romboutsia lituseburensis]|nr:ROK family protein [Romboutsia lituseburensis]MCR8746565.1 ROK family protein [Romboutsia lituseburensis]
MYFIGVDIGGTGVQAGIVDESGSILFRKECTTNVNSGFESIMDDINTLVRELIKENNLSMDDIKSIGFGVPSFINKKGLVTCVNLGWHEVDFIQALKNRFPDVSVYAENDATVAALGEAKFGSMKDKNIAVMYTLGTGVGGGIIINGKAFTGANGMGSEIGHTVIGENYFDCNCGNNGCLETFCSATAIIKHAQKLIEEGKNSKIIELAENNLQNINAKMVFDAYRENDVVALETINRFKSYLAKAMSGMINTLDPDVISIGGGVSRASDIILDGIEDLIRQQILYKKEDFADIVCANLGADAGIIGAAFLN